MSYIFLSLVRIVVVMLGDLSHGIVVVVPRTPDSTDTPIARAIFENEYMVDVGDGMKGGLRGNTKTNGAKKTRDISALKSMQKPIRSQLCAVGPDLPKPSQNSMSGQLSKLL